jgi:hypothetical protein
VALVLALGGAPRVTWKTRSASIVITKAEMRNPDPSAVARTLWKRMNHGGRLARRQLNRYVEQLEEAVALDHERERLLCLLSRLPGGSP